MFFSFIINLSSEQEFSSLKIWWKYHHLFENEKERVAVYDAQQTIDSLLVYIFSS